MIKPKPSFIPFGNKIPLENQARDHLELLRTDFEEFRDRVEKILSLHCDQIEDVTRRFINFSGFLKERAARVKSIINRESYDNDDEVEKLRTTIAARKLSAKKKKGIGVLAGSPHGELTPGYLRSKVKELKDSVTKKLKGES